MVFCNIIYGKDITYLKNVTILILIDGFLQYFSDDVTLEDEKGHNPYFNRWFSAMKSKN